MIINKHGNPPWKDKTFSCSLCNCDFKFEEHDVFRIQKCYTTGELLLVSNCPDCKIIISFYLKDFLTIPESLGPNLANK